MRAPLAHTALASRAAARQKMAENGRNGSGSLMDAAPADPLQGLDLTSLFAVSRVSAAPPPVFDFSPALPLPVSIRTVAVVRRPLPTLRKTTSLSVRGCAWHFAPLRRRVKR